MVAIPYLRGDVRAVTLILDDVVMFQPRADLPIPYAYNEELLRSLDIPPLFVKLANPGHPSHQPVWLELLEIALLESIGLEGHPHADTAPTGVEKPALLAMLLNGMCHAELGERFFSLKLKTMLPHQDDAALRAAAREAANRVNALYDDK